MNFSARSYEKELLDRNDIPFRAIEQNMKELEFINTYLGGHHITVEGCRQLLQTRKEITVCELGCGGGDNLLALDKWGRKNNIIIRLIGIDINEDCINVARSKLKTLPSKLIVSDYRLVDFGDEKPDIIFSSLFCHHFSDEELVYMLRWMYQHTGIGFYINDLHRHPLAYYSIKLLTHFFSKSYLVKNDAPLSVKRGFNKAEWLHLMQQAGIVSHVIKWKWAFRWLVVVEKKINQD